MITITFPTNQTEIPELLRKLNEESLRLQGELNIIRAARQSVQNMCAHPKVFYGTSCGESWTKCAVCEKEV